MSAVWSYRKHVIHRMRWCSTNFHRMTRRILTFRCLLPDNIADVPFIECDDAAHIIIECHVLFLRLDALWYYVPQMSHSMILFPAELGTCEHRMKWYGTHSQWALKQHSKMSPHFLRSTANPTWGDIFECCFKAQSSKLERLFSLKRGKRDVRALSFELSKMTPHVGLAVSS